VPFEVAVLKTGDCTKTTGSTALVTLPQLQVRDDGSGILMASSDKVTLDQLAGQAIVIGAPGSKTRVGCGVIATK
jgi:Cu/Zn superoxide dismutase